MKKATKRTRKTASSTSKSSTFARFMSSTKRRILFVAILFAAIGGVSLWTVSASTVSEVGVKKVSMMTLPSSAVLVIDSTAKLSRATQATGSGEITGSINTYGDATSAKLMARTNSCAGTSSVSMWVADVLVLANVSVDGNWKEYNATVNRSAGAQSVRLSYSVISADQQCERKIYLDTVSFSGVATPPVLTLSAGSSSIKSGQSTSINWSGSGSNSCIASGGWSGSKYANGDFSVAIGPLAETTTYNLVCSGYGGSTTKSVTVNVTDPYPFNTGSLQTILTRAQMEAKGLKSWPDSTSGILKSGSTYTFFSPGDTKKLARTTGTLDNPISKSVSTTIPIRNLKSNYLYYGGGTIYKDPSSSMLLMFMHTERQATTTPGSTWSTIAMAKSTDGGSTWYDLGEIISPRLPITAIPSVAQNIDMGGGAHLVIGDYFYVYFADRLEGNVSTGVSVARAKVSDVLAAAKRSSPTVVKWSKYYNGSWTEPALGGLSSRIESGGTVSADFPTVSYNTYLKKYIMVVSADWPKTNLYMLFSDNGINWSGRKQIESDPGEALYATLAGKGADPKVTDQTFFVYYTYSLAGGNDRWSDAILARRTITFQ